MPDKEFILKIESFRKTLEDAIAYCDTLMKEFYKLLEEDGTEH